MWVHRGTKYFQSVAKIVYYVPKFWTGDLNSGECQDLEHHLDATVLAHSLNVLLVRASSAKTLACHIFLEYFGKSKCW